MKYITLLGIIATLSSNMSLEHLAEIEEYKMAKIGFDVLAEKQGDSLVFKKASKNRLFPYPEVLDSDFAYAPFIVFTCVKGNWYAEQANDVEELMKMLDIQEEGVTFKAAIIGADKISRTANRLNAKYGHYSNTLLVELSA